MFFQGGVIIYPILLCSIIAAYVTMERFLVLRRAQLDVGQFMMKVRSIFQKGDVSAVLTFCSQKDAPIANIVRCGLVKHDQGDQNVREAVEDVGRAEVFTLKKHLSLLAGIAGVAPMLGFLGTATGIFNTFQGIQSLGENVNIADLAGGISQALLTTVFGLVVGIAAYTFYNYFITRVASFVHQMEVTTTEFLDLLQRRDVADVSLKVRSESIRQRALVYEGDEFFRKKR